MIAFPPSMPDIHISMVVKNALPALKYDSPTTEKKYTNEEINKAGTEALQKIPPQILRNLGDPSKLRFELGFYNEKDPGIAQTQPNNPVIRVSKPEMFMSDPYQFVIHELSHVARYRLPKELQDKFAKINELNPYGGYEKPYGEEGLAARHQAKGYNIYDLSPEELGMISQRYGSNQERIEELSKKLSTMAPGSKEYISTVNDIAKRKKYMEVEEQFLNDFDALFKPPASGSVADLVQMKAQAEKLKPGGQK